MTEREKTHLERLISSEKGDITYKPSESFLLHVHWEVPTIRAAKTLLDGLTDCARATERDTPCVPLYFFRISRNDQSLCAEAATHVSHHPHLKNAHKKLAVGVNRVAVENDLRMRGIDPVHLDLGLDDPLPEALVTSPVAVECTELYLDEKAFYDHMGSRDYLDAYGKVTSLALQSKRPTTLVFGTPASEVGEKILTPILQAQETPVFSARGGCSIWRQECPKSDRGFFLSLEYDGTNPEDLAASIPQHVKDQFSTLLVFAHPLREGTSRMIGVASLSISGADLAEFARLQPSRGEAHCVSNLGENDNKGAEEDAAQVKELLKSTGFGEDVTVNATRAVGVIRHAKSHLLQTKPA